MGWEQRGSESYFYRKKRSGARVRSVYVGRGEIAVLTARLDAMQREEREAQRAKERKEQQGFDSLDQSIDNLVRLSCTLTEAVLIAAGFHEHKRQWRKQKHERKCGSS